MLSQSGGDGDEDGVGMEMEMRMEVVMAKNSLITRNGSGWLEWSPTPHVGGETS